MRNRSLLRAYNIEDVDHEEIEEGIEAAPYFHADSSQSFNKLLIWAIGAVHSIPTKLFPEYERGNLEIYFGRAGATSEHLINRWRSGNSSAQTRFSHRHALILAELPTEKVKKCEGDTIRIFRTLRDNDTLCVRNLCNLDETGFGGLPLLETSVVYITWRFSGGYPVDVFKPTPTEIGEMSSEVWESLAIELSRESIKKILSKTRIYSHLTPLKWHKNHY